MVYRYQEWKDGLHNFDDHIFLCLELCLFLRENIQNHVSVSRVIDSLEGLRQEKFPSRDAIFHAYCHFEALTDTEYTFSCINCGFHPPVVVMDLHRKGVFNLKVSDLKAPPEDFEGEHNIEEFWNSVHLEMISRGFFSSSAKNPFAVLPSYEHWAPWIGSETRKSDIVLNTEFKKVRTCLSSDEAQLGSVTEDRLIDELTKQKVGVVRRLCRACKIDSKGSRFDLITRLRERMKANMVYDKVFQSIWGASGGWSVILCPHGIVYSIKFNLRAESPRDFADLLLCWKHIPNICVYDFARGLAAHTNLGVPHTLPFQPHEGRLAEPTEENIKAAQDGKMQVCLPWLHERMECAKENAHPNTGSSDHYVLYDRFHEGNTKDPKEILRRIQLVPELKGWLNSQVAEQFFANMRKSNYFLNNMSPSTHVFLMRTILHHHNTHSNKQLLNKQLRHGHRLRESSNITLSALGQAVIAPKLENTEMTLKQASSMSSDSEQMETSDHQIRPSSSSAVMLSDVCGPLCEDVTNPQNIWPSRSSWSFEPHLSQRQLLTYVLDISRPQNELIVETSKGCLTRADFWTLGLNEEMESTIGNACFEIIQAIAESKRISIYIGNLYVTRTWLPPYNCEPLQSLPVMKPGKKEMFFLDSRCAKKRTGFGGHQYVSLLRKLAENISPGEWSEINGFELEGFPSQEFGVDCGIFMLMSALYVVLDAPFDYTILDMPTLRKWWCLLLMENFDLRSYGKVFAHWTKESEAVLKGEHAPVFRLRKRKSVELSLKPAIISDLHVAMEWIEGNEALFSGQITFPKYLTMTEEHRQEALRDVLDGDNIEFKEPFLFGFQIQEDMEIFLQACVDQRGLRVNAVCYKKD
ncbi:uncharacterized protein [Paramormyrops kingsleyae]|uniref:uncharacterized protein n=1 Tax=Paramormyrops kingsleyae TaxID=1676925 RepID=UPI003B96A847